MSLPLSGKVVLVTGASAGIGLEASAKLAEIGAELLLVARDRARGERAAAAVASRSPSKAVSLMLCDFASQAQIRALAARVMTTHPRLHVLVNNAGSVNARREVTEDGLERTFAVNHLGPFLLTNLLLEALAPSRPARVVTVASAAHRDGTMPFDDLQFERGGYSILRAYARSKLANVLFTTELARRLAGSGVTANCLHPGTVATDIWSHAPRYAQPFLAVAKMFMSTVEQGAGTIVYLAADPEVDGQTGGYYERNRKVRPSRLAQDDDLAARLWKHSAALTGLPDASRAR
jgi:NAD(P)-dependent dehydrogenase (short-subunit alcohol dehydrogenase family)